MSFVAVGNFQAELSAAVLAAIDEEEEDAVDIDGSPSTPNRSRSSVVRSSVVLTPIDEESGDNPAALSIPKRAQGLISPPRQRQRWGDTQILPRVNWGDLFFDLFYVGAAYNLGGILVDSPSNRGILYFVGAFGPIYKIWLDKMLYDARFAADDDPFHRGFEVTKLCLLATAVVHIRPESVLSHPEEYVDMFAFSLGLVLCNVMNMLRYVEVAIWVVGEPAAKTSAVREMSFDLIPLLCNLAATVVAGVAFYGNDSSSDSGNDYHDDHDRRMAGDDVTTKDEGSRNDAPIYLCLAGHLFFTLLALVRWIIFQPKDHKKFHVPMNIDFSIHRLGEWIMLVLGESILSLVIVETSEGHEYYLTFYAGILSVIFMQYLHFRSSPHHADEHALRRSITGALVFSTFNQIYSGALIAVGASYKMLLYEYTYEDYNDKRLLYEDVGLGLDPHRSLAGDSSASKYSTEDRQQRVANMFCGSMSIAWVCLDIMILSHRGIKFNFKRCRCEKTKTVKMVGALLTLSRVGLVVFMATLSQYVNDPEAIALIGLAAILAQVTLRVLGSFIFDSQVHAGEEGHGEEKEEGKWPNVTRPRTSTASVPDEGGDRDDEK